MWFPCSNLITSDDIFFTTIVTLKGTIDYHKKREELAVLLEVPLTTFKGI